jgi:hypothetical protein
MTAMVVEEETRERNKARHDAEMEVDCWRREVAGTPPWIRPIPTRRRRMRGVRPP